MSILRKVLDTINLPLRLLNLKLDTLSKEKLAQQILNETCDLIDFNKKVYNQNVNFDVVRFKELSKLIKDNNIRISEISCNGGDYFYDKNNRYYNRPDFDVLYTIVKTLKPASIIEVGCGNSTKIIFSALKDACLDSKVTCIDPFPRVDITNFAYSVHKSKVQSSNIKNLIKNLQENDILFIDTSHEVSPGNDCCFLYCEILPLIPKGVYVHFHDIYIPFEYPKAVLQSYALNYGEQSLVSLLLSNQKSWELFFPTYYHFTEGFFDYISDLSFVSNSSFWLKKISND